LEKRSARDRSVQRRSVKNSMDRNARRVAPRRRWMRGRWTTNGTGSRLKLVRIGRKRSRGNALFKLQSWNSLRRKHDVEGNLPRRIETGHDDDDHFLREKERSIRDRVRSISGRFRALLLTRYILEHVRARTPHTARDERSDLCKRTLRKERTTTKILTTM